jgi:hypothetical protein
MKAVHYILLPGAYFQTLSAWVCDRVNLHFPTMLQQGTDGGQVPARARQGECRLPGVSLDVAAQVEIESNTLMHFMILFYALRSMRSQHGFHRFDLHRPTSWSCGVPCCNSMAQMLALPAAAASVREM